MQRALVLDESTARTLENLAREDGKGQEAFLAELVKKEDRKRHIELIPYGGERRCRCFAPAGCRETGMRSSLTPHEEAA